MKLKSLALLLMAALAPLAPTMASAQTYNIAVGDPEESEQGFAANAFKKYVEEKSEGKIKVQPFFSGALGDESETLRNVQKGTLPFAVCGIANLVPFEKKLGILTLPYLFSNLDEVVAGTTGKPAEILNSYATKAGFRVLTWTYSDFRYISNSKLPITTIEHMEGLKFRVPQSAVLIAAYKAFGGSPTPISWAETFTALQQGVVDGQCYGYIGFKAMKFNEANQKFLTEVHYTYQLQPIVMSERVYRKMDPATQELMVAAGKYAQEAVLEYQKTEGAAAKADLIASGVQVDVLTDEDTWKKNAFEIVWPEMAEFVGGEAVINEYLGAMGKPAWNK